MKWYENAYRRHLCDMHIDDWDESLLSEFTAENYYENLKRANVQAAMIYVQSHTGLCHYPTKSGTMHKAFRGREWEVRKLIDLCRSNGIKVVGYYSWIFNSIEHDKHPDWRIVDAQGISRREAGKRYGHCCINNPDYQEFVKAQLKEIAEGFTLDGIFIDMPFWPIPCYCDHCKARWQEMYGGEIPQTEDPNWELFQKTRKNWLGDHAVALYDYIKSVFGDISVEMNYAKGALPGAAPVISEKVNLACDYVGGDVSMNFLAQSFACKYYSALSKNQPFEYMPTRCTPDLKSHTVTFSPDKLKLRVMLTCAHHGASLMIDAIDPVGTMDARFYNKLGKVYAEEAPYEPYLKGNMVADVGMYLHYDAKFNPMGQAHNNYSGSMNAMCAMIEDHIPVGAIPTENRPALAPYKCIILSTPCNLTQEMVGELEQYVAQGGTLYFSDLCQPDLFEMLVGGKLEKYTEHTQTYIGALDGFESLMLDYNMKYPIPFSCSIPLVTGVDPAYIAAKVVLPYTLQDRREYVSIHSNPPGVKTEYPGLVIKPYGKGTVIWSAAPIENVPILDYKLIITNIVRKYATGNISVATDASANVELVLFRKENAIQVNAVCLVESDRTVIQPPFNVTVTCPQKASRVVLLPDHQEIPFTQEGDQVTFQTRQLNIFDMYEVQF